MLFRNLPPESDETELLPIISLDGLKVLSAGNGKLPALPESIAYYKAVENAVAQDHDKDWGSFKNTPQTGDLNDCTIAAAAHMVQLWSANNGPELKIPEGEIEKAYRHFVGGNTKKGLQLREVLDYWHVTGIGGRKITAYGSLKRQSRTQVKYSIALTGTCYVSLGLPSALFTAQTDPTTVQGGKWGSQWHDPRGPYAPNTNNGHAVALVGYTDDLVHFVTWGKLLQMTWQFLSTYVTGVWAVVAEDWISPGTQTSPSGLTLDWLRYAVHAIQRI